jgi:hypothetical protein
VLKKMPKARQRALLGLFQLGAFVAFVEQRSRIGHPKCFIHGASYLIPVGFHGLCRFDLATRLLYLYQHTPGNQAGGTGILAGGQSGGHWCWAVKSETEKCGIGGM